MHGDLWGGNILFDCQERETLICFLDFQFSRFDSAVGLDVIMLLCSSLESKVRREKGSDLIHTYVASREDLRGEEEEQKRLSEDIEFACLPLGLAFVVTFGTRTVRDGEGRLVQRVLHLMEDYCRSVE